MERALEQFAAIQFLIVGLSHILHPRAWVEFFSWLRDRGRAGIFVHGFLSLGFGSMILGFHQVWSGLPVVLTIAGCAYTLKAALCFLVPSTQEWSLRRVSPDRAWEFALPGTVFVLVGLVLVYSLWFQ